MSIAEQYDKKERRMNGWVEVLVGWENGMVTGKYMKMGWKRCFWVEAVG